LADIQIRMLLLSYRGSNPKEWVHTLGPLLAERETLWRERLAQPRAEVVHVADAAPAGLVGFALGGPAREPALGYEGEVVSLQVLPEHQHRGIGRELLRRIVRSLIDGGFRGMMVRLLTEDPTRIFYEKQGARPAGRRRVKIGDQELEETVYGWSDPELFFPP
jgi:GNAT superfamily N-acetyltransferase